MMRPTSAANGENSISKCVEMLSELIDHYYLHVPHILLRHMLSQVVDEFLGKRNPSAVGPVSLLPSMERYHGVLLFIDISGFTLLSSRLNVDDLRLHINAYFERILRIIDSHGGEVIKFAGDALFVLWQIPLTYVEDSEAFHKAVQVELNRAISCGLEINSKCSKYKISFGSPDSPSSDSPLKSAGMLQPVSPDTAAPSPSRVFLRPNRSLKVLIPASPSMDQSTDKTDIDEDNVAYLDVHSGLSVEKLAGMDIGAENRWEFLLFGKVLSEVALAESAAAKGELAISAAAHAYYHPSTTPQATEPQPGSVLPCGCRCLAHGCYSISSTAFSYTDVQMMLQDLQVANTAANSNQKYRKTVITSNNSTKKKVTDMLIKDINAAFDTVRKAAAAAFLPQLHQELDIEVTQLYSSSQLASSSLLQYFYIFTVQLLSNWILKHIHEAVRVDIEPFSVLNDDEILSLPNLYEANNKSDLQTLKFMAEMVSEVTKVSSSESNATLGILSTDVNDAKVSTFSAELRNVIILFITFGGTSSLELSTESSSSKNAVLKGKIDAFHFLPRTTNEYMQDTSTLQTYNGYLTLLVKLLSKYNGQLRQFIIDDKGIVGIGTFGLRNAVNYDNAAQAVEVAKVIVDQFQLVYNLQVGIGITSGRNYCGLVGSPWRCEYSVMGPSTNLAARLMVRANNIPVEQVLQSIEANASGNSIAVSQYDKDSINLSVLCDESIQTRDRTHEFAHLGTIQAKGYVLPVHIYAPLRSPVFSAQKMGSVLEEGENKAEDNDKGKDILGELTAKSKSTPVTPRATMKKQRRQSLLKSSFYSDIRSALHDSFLRASFSKSKQSVLMSKKSEAGNLYGRNAELQRVLKYLFHYLYDRRSPFSADANDGNIEREPDVFTTNFKSLVINITGPHGIGKTAFLYEVLKLVKQVPVHGESLASWQRNVFSSVYGSMESSSTISKSASIDVTGKKHRLNLKIVHRKLSNYTSTEPFFAWKSLLRKLMYHLLETKYQHLFGTSSASGHSENFYVKFNQIIYDFLRERFPDEVDSFLSLLSLVGLNLMSVTTHSGEHNSSASAVTASKVPAVILVSFAGFLAKIVQVLVNETGCVIVAAFDDAHFMDSYSWLLVRKIWADVAGMVIICTSHTSIQSPNATISKAKSFSSGNSELMQSKRKPSSTGSAIGTDLYTKRKVEGNDGVNFNEAFTTDTPRALHIELSTIDIVSATGIIQRVFNENTNLRNTVKIHGVNVDVDDAKFTFNANIAEDFYQAVYDLSGGNALYIIELAKVAMDNAKLLISRNLGTGGNPEQQLSAGKTAAPALPSFDRSLLQSFPAHTRVDEVISYRFDLLDNAAQLILKVAAAICCNGHYCNYHILCYIIYYYTYHKEMETVPRNSYFYQLMYDKSRRQAGSHKSDVAHAYHQTNRSILDITQSSPQSLLRLFSSTFKTVDVLKVLKHLVTSHEFLFITTHKISLDFMYQHQQMKDAKGDVLDNIYFFPVADMDISSGSGDRQDRKPDMGLYDAYDPYDSDSDDVSDDESSDNVVREARLTSHIDINQLVLLDNNILKHISYDFMARLEMQNIYNLMLEEQKIELHLAIANYFNFVFNIKVHHYYSTTIPRSLSANVSSRQNAYSWLSLPCIPSSDILEQSYHYRKGMAHNSVIVSLYHFACFLTNINAKSRAYEEYHSVYLSIVDQVDNYRQLGSCDFDFLEAENDDDDDDDEEDSEQSDAASLVSRNSMASRNELQLKLFSLKSPLNAASAFEKHINKKWFKLTKLDLYRLCNNGDSSLLEVYILTVIRLAQCLFSLYNDANMAVLLYEQAFHLILLTCRDRKVDLLGTLRSASSGAHEEGPRINTIPTVDSASTAVESEDKSVNVHQRGIKSGITTSDGIEYEDYDAFGISDFSLLFPIVSGMVMMYRLGYFSDDSESQTITGYKQNKEYKVIELYLTLAQSNPSYLPYCILGNCLMHNFFLHLHTNKAAKKTHNICMKIMESYDLTEHNPTIMQLYVFDIVPQTIAMQFLYRVWLQRPDAMLKILPFLVYLVPKFEHYNTLAATLLPLCIGLNCMGQCRYSFDLYDTTYFSKELNYDSSSTMKVSTLFSDYKQYFHLYLMLMSKYEELQVLCSHIKGEVSLQEMKDTKHSANYINNINHMNRIEAFLAIFMEPSVLQHALVADFMQSLDCSHVRLALLDSILIDSQDSPFMTFSRLEQQHQNQLSQEGSVAVSATRPLTHAGCDHVGASREYVIAASLYLHAVFALLSYRYKQAAKEKVDIEPSTIVVTLQRALDYVRYTLHITQPSIKTYFYSFMMALMLEVNILNFLLYLREHVPEIISRDSAVLYEEVRAASICLYRKTLDGLEMTFPLLEDIYLYHV